MCHKASFIRTLTNDLFFFFGVNFILALGVKERLVVKTDKQMLGGLSNLQHLREQTFETLGSNTKLGKKYANEETFICKSSAIRYIYQCIVSIVWHFGAVP